MGKRSFVLLTTITAPSGSVSEIQELSTDVCCCTQIFSFQTELSGLVPWLFFHLPGCLLLGTHIWQLTTACDCNSRRYDTLHTQAIKIFFKKNRLLILVLFGCFVLWVFLLLSISWIAGLISIIQFFFSSWKMSFVDNRM